MSSSLCDILKLRINLVFKDTRLLIEQLDDQLLHFRPIDKVRPLGEIVLHILRSGEAYMRGVITDKWASLPYNLKKYGTIQTLRGLYDQVQKKVDEYLFQLSQSTLLETTNDLNRPATKVEILLELLEHTTHHRGQITVYLRLAGHKPAKIPYIV